MIEAPHDVVALGNAIVDVLSQADDDFIIAHGLPKGGMSLISEDQARALYADMGPAIERSGGSAANTMVGITAMGGQAAFIGRVQDDQLGEVFAHDIRAEGVDFAPPPARPGAATGRCLVLVTPDAQRTMNTFLGAGAELGPDDVDPDLVRGAQVVYLEGYMWDPASTKDSCMKAIQVAKANGRKVALTLSDPHCVDRHREEFHEVVADSVDILFANEAEILSLYQLDRFDEAVAAIRTRVPLSVVTRGEKGCVVIAGDETIVVASRPPEHLVDTTGAGDMFAAGFLYGYTRGRNLAVCGRMGIIAATEIISHYGARPEQDLKTLLAGI